MVKFRCPVASERALILQKNAAKWYWNCVQDQRFSLGASFGMGYEMMCPVLRDLGIGIINCSAAEGHLARAWHSTRRSSVGVPGMNDDFWDLVDRLVPDHGSADTEQGELARAVLRVTAEFYRNGCGNWDDYYEALTQFAWDRFSDGSLDTALAEQARRLLGRLREYGRRQEEQRDEYMQLGRELDKPLECAAVQWCQRHPDPIPYTAGPDGCSLG